MERIVLGLIEKIKISGKKKEKEVTVRIDTGAKYNSIDKRLASELGLGPIVRVVIIKTSNGSESRPVVRAKIEIKGKKLDCLFNLTDRAHMKYDALIGQEVLEKNFLIDPSKK